MPRRRLTIPISIVLFLAATLVGTYLVRKRILEWHMVTAMEMRDEKAILALIESWPCAANARTRDGLTPLFWATCAGRRDAVDRLLRHGADPSPSGKIHMTAVTTGAGNIYGTALHVAAGAGRKDIVRLLLKWGADLEAKDTLGTPLDWAVVAKRPEMVGVLLEAGAQAPDGTTAMAPPLGWREDLAKRLLDHGVKVDRRDKSGQTSLHWAALAGKTTYLTFLLEKGADVNARDDRANTPLHLTARYGQSSTAELLLSRGADVAVKNKDGKTALMIAEEEDHGEVAELLRKHGAGE